MIFARKLFIALLALALLSAPCLSVIGPLGAGHAHAAAASHGHDAAHASHTHADHHDTAGHAGQRGERDGAVLHCCRLCVGWLTSKASDLRAVLKADPPKPLKEISQAAAIPPIVQTGLSPPGRISGLDTSQRPESVRRPLYVLTGRFRI